MKTVPSAEEGPFSEKLDIMYIWGNWIFLFLDFEVTSRNV